MNDTSNTTNAASQSDIPQSVSDFMRHITDLCGGEHARWAENFNAGFANTLTTTVRRHDDGTTFLLTGDIPAMWLRDSSAQFRPYLAVAVDDPELTALITGLVRQQFRFINIDPYANAFNETPSGATWDPNDQTDSFGPWLWERKYEVDSLCYPIQLAWLLYRNTGTTSHFDDAFVSGIRRILDVFETELDHSNSHYRFFRPNDDPRDSVPNHGTGGPFAVTGMTWSGFRPSDDACVYGYLIPSNMFAVVTLGYTAEIMREIYKNGEVAARAEKLASEIRAGIEKYGVVEHPKFGKMYAYETDGLGNYVFMDDANVPSLMSIPYLGYCSADDEIYKNTRAFVLSKENPYYYEGTAAKGVGSPHTPPEYIWHIALSMQGLTSRDPEECKALLHMLKTTDDGKGFMHEGFHKDDPSKFTRPWFAWSNSLFSEFVLKCIDENIL